MSATVLSRPLDVHSGDRERVLAKIKDLVVDWLDQLAGGDLPCFEMQNESDNDARETDGDGSVEGVADTPRKIARRLVLPTAEAGVGEIARSTNACVSYASILCVLSFAMRLLEAGKTATQREIYYAFVKHFANQTKCNDAILDCCALLGEPRHCLGIVASSRGYLAGRISIRGEGFEDWQDPRSTGGTSGLAITSDWLTRSLELKSDARYVVVVEKDGVFNRLVEDRFYDRIPSVLVTGQGFPPLAVRACVYRIAEALDVPVLGLVDCNPFGLSILLQYKEGSSRQGKGSAKYRVPGMSWVGLRPSQLDDLSLPEQARLLGGSIRSQSQVHQELSQQDLARAQSVAKSPLFLDNPDTYGEEVAYWIGNDHPGKECPPEGYGEPTLAEGGSHDGWATGGGGGGRNRGGGSGDACVLYHEDDGIATLTLNRPKSKNAFNRAVCSRLAELLEKAAQSESVVAAVLTGANGYFTSGADIKELQTGPTLTVPMLQQPFGIFSAAVLRFPKLLVAAVNGPAVGVGVTLLPHCDLVYAYGGSGGGGMRSGAANPAASSFPSRVGGGRRRRGVASAGGYGAGAGGEVEVGAASFWTPFFRLAIVPEFCSSVTFPEILGWPLANEMLVMGRKLNAQEAQASGLVSTVVLADTEKAFLLQVKDRLRQNVLAEHMAAESVEIFKSIMWRNRRPRLLRVLADECVELDRRIQTGHPKAALKHLARRPRDGSSKL
eukprot:g8718.t1